MDMDQRQIESLLNQAQNGDPSAKHQLLHHYRPLVIRTVSEVCKRYIDWHRDEASVGLLALNEAIERYDLSEGKSFENYVRLIVKSRLSDYFRSEKRKTSGQVAWDSREEDEFESSPAEIASSMESYAEQQLSQSLAEELMLYDEVLQEYGILLERLEEDSPDHQDTRKRLIQIAKEFCRRPDHLQHLDKTKQLPLKAMLGWAEVSRKTLERNRKYLIAIIIIYSSSEFVHIRSTISFAEVGE